MKGWVNPGATQCFWTRNPWIENPAPSLMQAARDFVAEKFLFWWTFETPFQCHSPTQLSICPRCFFWKINIGIFLYYLFTSKNMNKWLIIFRKHKQILENSRNVLFSNIISIYMKHSWTTIFEKKRKKNKLKTNTKKIVDHKNKLC